MNRPGLSIYLLAAMLFLALVDPSGVFSSEDTAYIVFERAGVSKDLADPYIIKKNEHLFGIIRNRYAVSETDIHRILQLIRKLNPELKDINVIHPGQKILLPRKRSAEISPAPQHPLTAENSEKRDKTTLFKYVVKSGDSISEIIHGFGNSYGDIYRILKLVQRLNPKVKNFNAIYPGQTLRFPSEVFKKSTLSSEDRDISLPEHKLVPVIGHIVGRMRDNIITEGKYCIPIPPSGEVTINCSKVPVIETRGGNTILLDLFDRIPADLKNIIETTWHTYRVVDGGERKSISSILQRVLKAASVYSLEQVNRQTKIGDTPEIGVLTDWIVSRKPQSGESSRYALNFLRKRSDLLPLPVKDYARRSGLDIIEIMDGFGIAGDATVHQSLPPQAIDSDSDLVCVASLLKILGYAPVEEVEIALLNGDGLSLSLKAELLVNNGGMRVIVTAQEIAEQVIRLLRDRGDKVVIVSDDKRRAEIIADMVRALDIPFSREDFRFSLSQDTEKRRGYISLPALRIEGDRTLHLVEYDVDSGIQALLRKEWKVELVRY